MTINVTPLNDFKRLRGSFVYLLIYALSVILCIPFTSVSAKENCSLEMNNQAAALLRNAGENWQSLLEHQKKFAACDDGELGEGYSDAVVRLFSQKWNEFGVFVSISRSDPAFKNWAIDHIDSAAPDADLRIISHNASVCVNGKGSRRICMAIQQAADDALVELGQKRP